MKQLAAALVFVAVIAMATVINLAHMPLAFLAWAFVVIAFLSFLSTLDGPTHIYVNAVMPVTITDTEEEGR